MRVDFHPISKGNSAQIYRRHPHVPTTELGGNPSFFFNFIYTYALECNSTCAAILERFRYWVTKYKIVSPFMCPFESSTEVLFTEAVALIEAIVKRNVLITLSLLKMFEQLIYIILKVHRGFTRVIKIVYTLL